MLNLSTLPEAQKLLLKELYQTPKHFVLYGGTAIALRLAHRESIDFDFFSNQTFVPSLLFKSIPYLKGAKILQSSENTLVCLVERKTPVQVSFFGGLSLNRVKDPVWDQEFKIALASLTDLTVTKLKVIQDRASFKDYFDLYTLFQQGITLDQTLSDATWVYGDSFNPLLSLKALTFFEDGDLFELETSIQEYLKKLVKDYSNELPPIQLKDGLKGIL